MSVISKIRNRLNIIFGVKERRTKRIIPAIKAYETIHGWLLPQEAAHLYHYASRLDDAKKNTVVEIGSWQGKSTYCIASGLRNGTVHAIDPFNSAGEEGSEEDYKESQGESDLLDTFTNNMVRCGVDGKVESHKGFSQDFVNSFESIDMLFIDGDHSIDGCKFDFENYHVKIPVGGLLLFHDYRPNRKDLGSTWVIENLVEQGGEYELLGIYKSLWVGKKIKA